LLEYYQGIMILTTNRVSTLDSAFKSRIHLAIKYPNLDATARRKLWQTFITHENQRPMPRWMTKEDLDKLSQEELNGRQIKNVVRTAKALAEADSSDIRAEDINISLNAIKDFDRDFAEESERGQEEPPAHDVFAPPGHRTKRRRLD
jgi:AAA+ superfamily predicted ATPase